MKLVIVFGPLAVGKMTVGQELEKKTELKLFHNHMTIELVSPFFAYTGNDDIGRQLVLHFREEIFKAVANSDLDGSIFTFARSFDKQSDWDYINKVCNIFESKGGDAYFVELEANVDERLQRNATPNRLKHKPTKRNIEESINNFRQANNNRRNSNPGEIKKENYIKIDNTNLNPDEVAAMIVDRFGL